MAQGYLAQVQALIDQRMKENPEEMKRKLKEIERAKKAPAPKAPKAPPKPLFDPQLTQELIEELAIITWEGISFEKVKYLIERGADIKAEREDGFSALYVASYFGDIELVKECLQAGMDVNVSGNKHITPLHWAIDRDNIEMTKFLIASGADVRVKADVSPLDWANSEEMKDLLRKHGAK